MNPPNKILERIQKLLNLADERGGGTEAERLNAAERAQKLMQEHNIEQFQLKEQDEVTKTDSRHNRTAWWEGELLIFIGQANLCTGYYTQWGPRDRSYTLIGRPENMAFAKMLQEYLIPFLKTEAKIGIARDQPKNPAAYKRAFFREANNRIHHRLMDQRRVMDADSTGMGLVLHETAALDKWMDINAPSLRKSRNKRLKDFQGASAGYAAGNAADIAPSSKLNT